MSNIPVPDMLTGGRFVRMGNKYGTTYAERGDAMYDLIDDYVGLQIGLAKSAGAATYGDNGYINAIMGKEITAAMFSSDNVFTAIGARPYQHEGCRIAPELASYGLDASGNFVGLGAGTIQDGAVPESVKLPVDEVRMPYKDLPFSFDIGMSLPVIESKDDTIAYRDYIEKVTANYSDLADKTILRPLHIPQPVEQGIETSMNSIQRAIASFKEIGTTESGVEITAEDVAAYGGHGNSRGDMYNLRTIKESNYDGNYIDAKGGTLGINDMLKLWKRCSVNWPDAAAPNGKVWFMGNLTQAKLGSIMQANNYLTNSVYVQRSFNGIKTIPGRGAGVLLHAFNDVPIIQDGNINFNYTTKKVSDTVMGDVMLIDTKHIWLSMLTPVELYNINNPAITRMLQERNVMNMRAELRIDSFIQHGRLNNLADEEA